MKKTSTTFRCAIAALSAVTTFQAHAANPSDPGTSGYTTRYYVDNTSTCRAPQVCGTQAAPFATLKEAFDLIKPGTEIIIAGHAGQPYYTTLDGKPTADLFASQHFLVTRNLNVGSSQKGTLIRAWNLGNNVLVNPVIRGSLRFGGWTPVAGGTNLYALTWTMVAQGLATRPDPINQPNYYVYPVMDPQQVYRGQTKLEQVGGQLYNKYTRDTQSEYEWPTRAAGRTIGRITPADGNAPWQSLGNNQFYYDKGADAKAAKTLYVKLASPLADGELLEVSTQQFLLDTAGAYNLTIKNLTFERSNGSAFSSQNSAVNIHGTSITLDGVTVQDADAICLYASGSTITVKNGFLLRCGQMGLAASGSDHKYTGNTVQYNNDKGFNEWWAGSGIKIIGNGALTRSEFSGNTIAYNRAHGIWLDTDPSYITIKDNHVVFNGADGADGGGIGIFIEISSNNTISGNRIVGNVSQGIQLKGSNNTVSGNLMVGNRGPGAVQLVDDRAPVQTGNQFTSNRFAWNDDYVVGQNHNSNAIGVLSGSTVNFNKYCGTDVLYVLDSTVKSDLPGWRALKMDTLFSSETIKPYPLRANLSQPLQLGDRILARDPQILADTKSGALASTVTSTCKW